MSLFQVVFFFSPVHLLLTMYIYETAFHLCFRQTQYVDLTFQTDSLKDVENAIFTDHIGSSLSTVNGSISLWPVLHLLSVVVCVYNMCVM